MSFERLFPLVQPWLESQLRVSWDRVSPGSPVLRQVADETNTLPLLAVRSGDRVVCATTREIAVRTDPVFNRLHPDQLFSILGAYELSRETLPLGTAVWGPVPNYVADRDSWSPVRDSRAAPLAPESLVQVDRRIFWHCNTSSPAIAFGMFEDDKLVALASVTDHGDDIAEIGVDVAPDHKGGGLGPAVVSAAGNWILDHGLIIHATVALWNVPSSRTMMSLGLGYVFSELRGRRAPFTVPPQVLGKPRPETVVYDAYPRWAMNREITPNPANP